MFGCERREKLPGKPLFPNIQISVRDHLSSTHVKQKRRAKAVMRGETFWGK
jgi:hypothetical protein